MKDTISTLNTLTQTCLDDAAGFKQASEKATTASLKQQLLTYSSRCTAAARELEQTVTDLGGAPEREGSVSGSIRRGWTGIKSSMSSDKDLAILEECERAQDSAKQSYRDALASGLPSQAQIVVERQMRDLIAAHDQIRSLRNAQRAEHAAA
jgi:uncharacterized protein (TIGR02284 family)